MTCFCFWGVDAAACRTFTLVKLGVSDLDNVVQQFCRSMDSMVALFGGG